MHAVIDTGLITDPEDDNLFVYNDDPRDPMKSNDGAYSLFQKDIDVDEVIECASIEIEVYVCDQYIGAELQPPKKDEMKRMS